MPKQPTISPIPISGDLFSKLSAKKPLPPKKATSKYTYYAPSSKAAPSIRPTSSKKYLPLSIITSYLLQTNPYKNSTHEIIKKQLQLRLINKQYSLWILTQTFQRLSFREFQNIRTITFQDIRKLLDMGQVESIVESLILQDVNF